MCEANINSNDSEIAYVHFSCTFHSTILMALSPQCNFWIRILKFFNLTNHFCLFYFACKKLCLSLLHTMHIAYIPIECGQILYALFHFSCFLLFESSICSNLPILSPSKMSLIQQLRECVCVCMPKVHTFAHFLGSETTTHPST